MNIGAKRIDLIDSLRGLALFGILITHSITQFLGVLPADKRELLNHNFLDTFFTYTVSLFVGAKFFLVFSFLFGVGFWLQYQNRLRRKQRFNFYYIKRMFILSIFGLFNYCFFQGDILIIYAIVSLPLLFIKNIDSKYLLWPCLIFLSGLPRIMLYTFNYFFGNIQAFTVSLSPEPIFQRNFMASTTFSFTQVVQMNLENWSKMVSIFQFGFVGRAYQILACFILGVIAARAHFFTNIKSISYTKTREFKLSCITSVICLIIVSVLFMLNPVLDFSKITQNFMVIVYDWFNISFTLIIIYYFMEFSKSSKFEKIYSYLKWPGRMSLTTYICQSLFFSFFYFNWGLGFFNTHGVSVSLLIACAFFAIQSIFANLWLQKFKQGPFETIWRKLSL